MSTQNTRSPEEILEDAIAEVNLVDRALRTSGLLDTTNAYGWVVSLIDELRRGHGDLVRALETHAKEKDRLNQGVLGSLGAVIGTIPSWVKIKHGLRTIKNMLNKLEKTTSANQQLLRTIEELRQATQDTRASLSAYDEIRRESEGRSGANAVGPSQGTPLVLTAAQATTNTRYHVLQQLNNSLPSPTGEARSQGLRPAARIVFSRDRSPPTQYFETVEETPSATNRRSTDIPPPEPEPPYIPPNALSPPPRRQVYANSSFAQAIESGPLPQPERTPATRSSHTRGLSDLSAFNNANRSTSTFSSQGYAGSLSPGYGSSGSDLPRQIRAEGSIGGDSCGSSERLEGTQIIGHTVGHQSETSSLAAPSRTSQNIDNAEGPRVVSEQLESS